MKLNITHNTSYTYESELQSSYQLIKLHPKTDYRQNVKSWNLQAPKTLYASRDGYGNICYGMTLREPCQVIQIQASGEVDILDEPYEYADDEIFALIYLNQTHLTAPTGKLLQFARDWKSSNQGDLEGSIWMLTQEINKLMAFDGVATEVKTTGSESFEYGSGVCQDYSHIMIAVLRESGIPARYISGYLHTSDSNHLASHAWVEAYIDGFWKGFDPTNASRPAGEHLRLAVGLDYKSAAPIKGTRHGGGQEFLHSEVFVSQTHNQ